MTRYVATEQATVRYAITGDVYCVQRRPQYAQLVINDNYRGVRLLDAWTGRSALQQAFTPSYDRSGVIDAWCFDASGSTVLTINQESGTASWIALDAAGACYDLDFPRLGTVADLRYSWTDESFWITSGKSYGFHRLDWNKGRPRFVERHGLDARLGNRRWRRAVDLLPSYKANVLRVESDHAQMLYHDFSHNPGRVGVVSWHSRSTAEDDEITVEQSWSAPVSGEIPALAFAAGYMFILQEYEVQALNSRGEVELIYPVPEGCQYVGFDTIPAHGSNPVALILVCSSLANGGMATASVYTL